MIDTHSHYAEAGAEDLYFIKLNDATSVADIVARVKERVAVAKPGEWVRGRGWDEGELAERRYIYAADLDAVSPNNPVLLTNTSVHYATVNSYALKLAGIDDGTRNPANGTIDRDAAGHPIGILKEGALAPIRALIPPFTAEQIKQGILKEIDDLHREGVTAFKGTAGLAQRSALHALNDAGLLDERVCMLWRAGESVDSARQTLAAIQAASPTPREYQHGRLAVCGAKSSWTAPPRPHRMGLPALAQKLHRSTKETGYPNMDPEVYRQMVRLFHQAGVSVGTHAIGDRAIDWVVDTYALVLKEKPTPGLRHTIIHAYLPTPHAVTTMAALQKQYDAGYPEFQPGFLWFIGKTISASLGPDRVLRTMPLKTYLDNGVRWGGGSDYYVTPYAARYGLWASSRTRDPRRNPSLRHLRSSRHPHRPALLHRLGRPTPLSGKRGRHPGTRQASRHRHLGQQPLHHPLRKTQRHQM